MDAALKARWVEALRSGDYQQTRGKLKDGDGYCCLGVLCEVAGLPIRADGGGVVGHGDFSNSFNSYEPIFKLVGGYEKSHPLSMRNDGGDCTHLEDIGRVLEPHSFAQIADYIEQNL